MLAGALVVPTGCAGVAEAAAPRTPVRFAESEPLMRELKSRMTEVLKDISAKSSLAEAIRYTLGHWDGLTMFLTDKPPPRPGSASTVRAPCPFLIRSLPSWPIAVVTVQHCDLVLSGWSRPALSEFGGCKAVRMVR
jgi:hypothetical protein